jgi:hypothetical protein
MMGGEALFRRCSEGVSSVPIVIEDAVATDAILLILDAAPGFCRRLMS